jgi:hypothetical protein
MKHKTTSSPTIEKITTRISVNMVNRLRHVTLDQKTSLAHQIVKAIGRYQ